MFTGDHIIPRPVTTHNKHMAHDHPQAKCHAATVSDHGEYQ